MSKETKGILFILCFQILVGLSPVFIKGINTQLQGSLLVFIRYTISSFFFLPLIFLNKNLLNELRNLNINKMRGLVFLGLFSSGLGSLLFVFAVRMIGASLSSVIEILEIPVGIIFAAMILKERITRQFFVIGTIILAGFYMLTFKSNLTIMGGTNFFIGIAIAFSTAIIFGFSTVFGKILLKDISPTIVSFFRQGFGAIFNLIIALFAVNSFRTLSILQAKDWILLLILGVFAGGLGFILYYNALKMVEVKKISFFFIAAPVTSVILGVIIGERLSLVQWLGAFIVLVGIAALLRLKEAQDTLPEKEEE